MKLVIFLPLALVGITYAHPGHIEAQSELNYKRNYNAQVRRGLESCADKLQKRGLNDRAARRRAATVEKYRKQIAARDTDSVLATSHLSNQSYTPSTSEATIFEQSNTCVLNPDGETGPYWVKGEYLRQNLRENQTGVPIVIEGQFLDVETCEPLTDVWWDVWNCNATGVYSGVVETGNGDTNDLANINATFLRGIQKTDSEGVVTFESIFPGHYSGRATHHHMAIHTNATVLANNTLSGGSFVHVGQLFWDQDLITKVEASSPYNQNDITITENADDRVFSTETADTTSDPVFEYVYLGDDLSDGIFGWITVAVNTSATYDPAYSFELTSSGGIAASGGEDSVDGGSGMGGNMTGNATGGAMPSGAMPSGSAMSSGFATFSSSARASASTASSAKAVSSGSTLAGSNAVVGGSGGPVPSGAPLSPAACQ